MALLSLLPARPCYLVDFSVYKPPDELKVDTDEIRSYGRQWKEYTPEMEAFMLKIFVKSGISGFNTYLPASIHPKHTSQGDNSMTAGNAEARMVMLGAVGDLLKKTGVEAQQVDILVTCCSIYCPTPSASSMIVNHFGMRSDIQSYSLGGMGCATGVLGISLLSDLLKARPNSIAVFVPAEITSYCFYNGQEPNRMVSNVIFRMGGAAIMLSNRADMGRRARYQLEHATRVHTAADDGAYRCMSWGPDKDGINGVYLGKDVVQHASKALEKCLRKITPLILTRRQKAEAVAVAAKDYFNYYTSWLPSLSSTSTAAREAAAEGGAKTGGAAPGVAHAAPKGLAAYKPDFMRCVDHFAIHAGMGLPAGPMLPSFASMRDFGNTSCSTTWYILAYLETMNMTQPGERVLQIGMGGGMKVGINSWRVLRPAARPHAAWAHLNGCPLTEDELPRGIEAVGGAAPPPREVQVHARPAQVQQEQQRAGQQQQQEVQQGKGGLLQPGGVELDDHGVPVEYEAI